MDVEGGLIARVLESEAGLLTALERRITAQHFLDEWHHRVWVYLIEHWQHYGTTADLDVVHKAFPVYEVAEPTQDVAYYVDQLLTRQGMATIMDTMAQAVDVHSERGQEGFRDVLSMFRSMVEQVNLETASVNTVDYADEMLRSIDRWRNPEEDLGITFGFPTLDQHTSGMRPEQYVIFTGLAKAKKSWSLLWVASTAQIVGRRVVYITFEMSNTEQVERLATLWAHVPYSKMRDKQHLTEADFDAIGRYARIRQNVHPLVGVHDAYGHSTVSSLQALARDQHAEVVCIDGIYLMTDEITGEPGSAGTQPLTNISRALKRMAKAEKIVVVGTTQSLFSKTSKGRLSLGSLGYTSAFSQDADLVVGVEQVPDDDSCSTMRILGNRNGPQGVDFTVRWDLDSGLVEEVDAADLDEVEAPVDEATALPRRQHYAR